MKEYRAPGQSKLRLHKSQKEHCRLGFVVFMGLIAILGTKVTSLSGLVSWPLAHILISLPKEASHSFRSSACDSCSTVGYVCLCASWFGSPFRVICLGSCGADII